MYNCKFVWTRVRFPSPPLLTLSFIKNKHKMKTTTKLVSSTIEAFVKKFKKQADENIFASKVNKNNKEKKEEPEKSKGQLFKEKYGFSKTFKRNCQKAGYDPYNIEGRNAYRHHRQLIKSLK